MMKIGPFEFSEPVYSTDLLPSKPGVYVVLDNRVRAWHLIDVGESSNIRERVKSHDRAGCWKVNATGTLAVAAHYFNGHIEEYRRRVEGAIRSQFDPPCGKI